MKRAYVLITPEFISNLCKQYDPGYHFKVDGGIPDDAKFITAYWSDDYRAFKVIFEHDSFKDIPPREEIPALRCPIFIQIDMRLIKEDIANLRKALDII